MMTMRNNKKFRERNRYIELGKSKYRIVNMRPMPALPGKQGGQVIFEKAGTFKGMQAVVWMDLIVTPVKGGRFYVYAEVCTGPMYRYGPGDAYTYEFSVGLLDSYIQAIAMIALTKLLETKFIEREVIL